MPGFKDYVAADINNVFLNLEEFGEPYKINGRTLNIIVDNDRLMERSKKEYDGTSVGEILYYVSAADYGKPPKIAEYQTFDSMPCQVFDVRIDNDMYEIILQRNE